VRLQTDDLQRLRGEGEGGWPRASLQIEQGDDTIEWLVKNVPESNGKVGMLGSSYEGFTVVMALVNPYVKATQRVYHAAGAASFIELPVVKSRDQGTRDNGVRERCFS